jgi:hypothetical protein
MSRESIVVPGTVKPDGTLDVTQKVGLPPGPVEVTVRSAKVAASGESVWTVLDRIHAEQQARGYMPRTREEIDAQINEMRDEWEERQQAIERLQEECARARRRAQSGEEPLP